MLPGYKPTKKRSLLRLALIVLIGYVLFVFLSGTYALNFIYSARAASSPWNQTDWSGGVGASTATQYSAATSIKDTVAGEISLSVRSGWLNESWLYRQKITFDNSAQAENLVDFPVMVKLVAGSNIDYAKLQSAGQDLRFTDSDGTTLLSYQIEMWDTVGGTSTVWVKVPQIDASSATDNIYMYYGNAVATDAQNVNGTWNSSYKMVMHLGETSGTAISDSTSSALNGVKLGSTTPSPITGQFDGAQNFNGSPDRIDITDGFTNTVALDNTHTIDVWVKPTAAAFTAQGVVWDSTHSGDSFLGEFASATGWYWSTRLYNSMSFTAGTWYHIVAVKNGTGDTGNLYVNGVLQTSWTGSLGNTIATAANLRLGAYKTGAFNMNGIIDEFRISDSAYSSALVAAEYKSGLNTFNTFGAEEVRYTSGTLTSNIFDSNLLGSFWGTLTYATTLAPQTTVKVRTSNSATMSGAPAFSTCAVVASGTDLTGASCAVDADRYIQYEVGLSSTTAAISPVFSDISIAFTVANAPPVTPTNTTPSSAAVNQILNPVLVTSAFSDTDLGDTHTDTQWQLDDANTFTTPEWTRTAGAAEVTTTVNAGNGTFAGSLAGQTSLAHSTVYYWRVRYQDNNGNWSSYSTPTTFTTNAIATPTVISPLNASTISTATPTLIASAFSDPTAGHTHQASQWLVDSDISFATPVLDTGTTAGPETSHIVPAATLTNHNQYYWKVRYQDNFGNWSSYSTPSSFEVDTSVAASLTQAVGWNQVYSIGDTARFTIQTLARDNANVFQPLTADTTPIYRLRFWDGATWQELVANATMTLLAATATYEATYAIPSDAAWIGRRVSVIFQTSINGMPSVLSREIQIVGSPAQVLITSMASTAVPNIAANVVITNEGTAAFEYLYEYCVVTVSTNVCGGGDDTAYASAAKLIQPSANFITTLGLSVPTAGNYFFKVTVWWSNQSSTAQLGFTATVSTVVTGSSGGSSGSGTTGTAVTPTIPATPLPDSVVGTGFIADILRSNAEMVARVFGLEEKIRTIDDRVTQLEQTRVVAPVYQYVAPQITPSPTRLFPIRWE